MKMPEFTIPLGDKINELFDHLIPVLTPVTKTISNMLSLILNGFQDFLLLGPSWLVIILIGALVWFLAGKRLAIFGVLSLLLMLGFNLWSQAMATLSLVIVGTLIALVLGIPLGIWASQNNVVEKTIRPILDFMQTLPSFVYLIPAVVFFGLGKVAAVVATLIFAMPPAIRLTNLGIRQVPGDMIEASKAFGATRTQILLGVQLPIALPTIMAGVNQCIMMSLSMAVIAAMIGAGGLGGEVLKAMQTVNIGQGTEAGIGIVVIAILLDRITEKVTGPRRTLDT
ncbi:MAG: ABC transporter permease [Bacillota bacterium]|jgi:glycine betaine/proline transport system permease protein